MTELQDARHLLDRAERAATAGDLASADELLRGAARIQEEELGPLHPDLANTLNNLAIVAERRGSSSEAETLYRRAAAIAAAALPSDHPMVLASRQNLEDFCRAHGLSIDAPAVIAPTPDTGREENASASKHPTEADEMPVRPVDSGITAKPAPPPSAAPLPNPGTPATTATQPLPPVPTPGRASHSLEWVAIGAVVLVAAVFLLLRPWSFRDASSPAPTAKPAAAQSAEAMSPRIAAPPTSLPRSNRRDRRPPRLLAIVETSPLTSRPPQAASPWPPRSYAAPSRRVAAAGAAIRWVHPRRRDRWSSTRGSDPRVIPQWCIAGITGPRCGNP